MATGGLSSDQALVRAARGGDRAASTELVRRHAAGVISLLSRVLLDRELALDLAQETFLRAHQNLDRFDETKSFRPWLHAIASHLALDELRKRRRHRLERLGLPGAGEDQEEGSHGEVADHREELPETWLLRQEERELVHRALGHLPPKSRLVLVLRDLEGLSYDEVARVMRCRLGTAKSRINRARLEFRDAYLRVAPRAGPYHGRKDEA